MDRPYLLLSLASLFWAINVVLGRYIAGTIPPATLAQVRWGGAGVILAVIAWPHLKRDWPAIRRNPGVLLLLGLCGITLYNTMAYYGLQYTQAINALLMQSSGPLLVGLWSLILFRDRLTPAQLVGILISLAGVVVIITRGHPETLLALSLNRGDVWLVAAMAVYAVYTVMLRKRPAIHFLSFLAFTICSGAVMLVPIFLIEFAAGYRMDPTPAAFAVLGYVVVFPSIVAYFCFNRGVELIGANRAGQFFHLIPVFGSAIAIVFLGERPEWFHGLGYAVIIIGIVVAQRRRTAPA
ncbi:MAG: DMT family transporter [Bauldia sp.]|nr:DMT family transporter [Bauldia sp.]